MTAHADNINTGGFRVSR